MYGIWDAETLHSIGVSPLLEVLLVGSPAPIAGSSADLTLELFAQAVQFVQPVWNWLSVPAKRQIFEILIFSFLIFTVALDENILLFLFDFEVAIV